jgi:hypothetical protein
VDDLFGKDDIDMEEKKTSEVLNSGITTTDVERESKTALANKTLLNREA